MAMKAQLAIYDMDRTITRRATYTPFLVHAALRLAPWRLVFFPLVLPPWRRIWPACSIVGA
jgi:hypothetical protein